MNSSSDSQPAPQKPEQFAEYLRQRVQEAVTASVHHASLSQQYLSLSQRFSALAEQASAGNVTLTLHLIQQLEREVNTGFPAAPMTAVQPAAAAFVVAQPVSSSAIPATNHTAQFSQVSNSETYEQEDNSPPGGVALEDVRDAHRSEGEPPHESAAALEDAATFADVLTIHSVPELTDEMNNSDPSSVSADMEPVQSQLETASVAQHKEAAQYPDSVKSASRRTKKAGVRSAEGERAKAKKLEATQQSSAAKEELPLGWRGSRRSTVISLVIHGVVLVLLVLRQLDFFEKAPVQSIPIFTMSDSMESDEELISLEPPAEEIGEQLVQKLEEIIEMPVVEPILAPTIEPQLAADLIDVSVPTVEIADASLSENSNGSGTSSLEATDGTGTGGIGNRSQAGRQAMLKKYGGSAGSESAVGSALEWLASRQRVNGTWDFVDVGPCTNPGSVNNPIGGTAYALLPFLAAGQTHKEGQHKKQVEAGLDFLTSVGVAAPAGYDLRGVVNKADDDSDPNYAYYVHGAATLALCEAYGMTKDRKLKPAAEGAVSFLVNSQDPRGGGWRYNPQQGGSTSATTIQVMALKAAEKAGIKVPDATWKGVSFYLDSVSVDGSGRYGYEVQKKEYAMSVTSMALLSRMYLGWGRDDGDLRAGIALVGKSTSTENYYTNYFATQVMKNWGGPEWERWNVRIRDDLVARQETEGPAKGSWAPRDRADYSKSGGRLLTTCLATLTLEVYYRYQPLLPEIAGPGSLQSGPATAPAPPAEK